MAVRSPTSVISERNSWSGVVGSTSLRSPISSRCARAERADKGIAHAKDTYVKAKVASEEAADLLQNTYAAVAKGATDYNLKLFEIARTNTRAAFDYAHELLGVKSPSEFIELSTAQMRKQFDMFSAQNKELCALAQEVVTEAAEPIKTGVSEAFNTAR